MTDIRDAFRTLRATPIVTIVAILSLALGIGANAAIFSILDTLMLRTLPVKSPDRLAVLGIGNSDRDSFTNPIWEQIRDRRDLVDGAFAYSSARFNLSTTAQTDFVDGFWASGRIFDVLGVPAILGRTFTEADDRRGGGPDGPVAVISYRHWQSRYSGAADVIGRQLTIDRLPYTIIGVTPPDFFGVEVGRTFDVAIPIGTEPLVRGKESALDRRSYWWLSIFIRTRSTQSFAEATAALRGVQPQVREATIPLNFRAEDKTQYLAESFVLTPAAGGNSYLRDRYRTSLLTIMGVVALVLLIACANIANLLLARATARRHEMSVRLALGASRGRLIRLLLTESLLLAGCGAALAIVFARWGATLLVRQLSTSTNTVFLDIGLNWRVLGFTALIAVATALLFGTAPAFRASGATPNEALKEHGRSVVGDRRFGLGNFLVVLQVAMSLLLIVAAGLFIRTFSSLSNLQLGFDRNPILVANVNAARALSVPEERAAFYERLRQAAAGVPGVASAAASAVTPVSGSTWQYTIERVDDRQIANSRDDRSVYVNLVSPGWFQTFGTRFLGGRDLTDRDTKTAPHVAIVNEAFARKFMNGANPIGHHFRQPDYPDRPAFDQEVVGYVQDAVYRSLRAPVPATIYVPITQHPEPPSGISISVRAAGGSPALLTKSVAAALAAVHPDITMSFRSLAEQVDSSLIQERIVAMMSGFFGGLALLLAGLGLYGITSYAVSRRRTELGIRMALGAGPGGVVRLVLQRVAVLVSVGLVAGTIASWMLARFVATLLFGLEPHDRVTLAGAAFVLIAIAALAGWIPARRASHIDPARVLREG
jgi:putative ABC transport system permease protein